MEKILKGVNVAASAIIVVAAIVYATLFFQRIHSYGARIDGIEQYLVKVAQSAKEAATAQAQPEKKK